MLDFVTFMCPLDIGTLACGHLVHMDSVGGYFLSLSNGDKDRRRRDTALRQPWSLEELTNESSPKRMMVI